VDTIDTVAAPDASEVSRIRGLIRKREFADALSAGEALLAETPDQRDTLLFVAIAQRYLGRIPEALATLATLERHHPRFSRLHEERGHCHVAMKRASEAIEAFLLAVNINHALPASWAMLEGLYRMTGEAANAAMAASHVATLRKLPREVVVATGLFMDGDLDAAEPMIRNYLLEYGNEVEAMRLLARIGMARKVYEDAELLLAAVMDLAPDYRAARSEYAETLIEMHKYSQARRELDQLLKEDPDNRHHYQGLHAVAAVGLGEHERAVALYRDLIAATSEDPDLHLSLAHALKTMGRREEAIESYRRAEQSRPGFGDAYWSLANLKTYRFTEAELGRLQELQTAPAIGVVDRYHLHFALGKALEDRGDYDGSFHYYELGNGLRRSKSNYRPEIIENNTRQQIAVCSREFFARRQGWGAPAPDPIFIVGLPRAGSTLLEQILASTPRSRARRSCPTSNRLSQRCADVIRI